MLEVTDLSAGYGAVRILDDVSLHVHAGETVAILGSNGAGKTTLFRALFGLVDVYAGDIRFGGEDARARPAHALARAGLVHVPEGRGLFPSMTVRENLMVPVYAGSGAGDEELELVFESFPRLRDRLSQTAGTMSGGEQQMLAIARGLMARPKLLLLDEPSIGLAPKLVEEVFERLRHIRERTPELGLLIVEQSVAETVALCDRGYVMERGRIVHAGDRSELESTSAIEQAFIGTFGAAT
jgi:branched-chain amino acid transport system ATP-binding protein